MTKILFLLPPSEGKQIWGEHKKEKLSFEFGKPCELVLKASEKDLKCKWERYNEAIELNRSLCEWKQKDFLEALKRYSWVMYDAIDYENMTDSWKDFFDKNFLIFSWMYWILKPKDLIWNYKFPLEKAEHYKFWWDKIPEKIIELKPDFVVNLLPINYAKLIWLGTNCSRHKKKLEKILNAWIKVININFLKSDWKKVSHWVKKIKWEWIKNICEKNIIDYKDFWWKIIENWNRIDINLIVK
jgi:cytoplasmic iron level regulating protein YaaA (DUF328/UPF0246 family)